jgi:hypothetical protein
MGAKILRVSAEEILAERAILSLQVVVETDEGARHQPN